MRSMLVRSLLVVSGLLISTVSVAAQDTAWQVRFRGIAVVPDEEATISAINGDVDVEAAYVPEVDFTVFLTPNVAAELILATTKHEVTAMGTDLGDVDLGSVWLLPPTVTLQYHFAPDGPLRPYIGAGGNLTLFYNVEVPGTTVTDAEYATAVGFALQAGADIMLGDGNWFLNLDAKKIFMGTDVELNDAAILADVTLNPWVIGVGFGYAFPK